MSLYRPTQFSGGGVRGDVTPFTGTNELGHAGLSAGAEASLTGCPADIGKAHTFFSAAAAGAEAHAVGTAALAPAAEAGLMHMPLVPGASEPISPLIQLIMRMPGQIGLFSSFFEALGNFFLPHLHALGLDPSILDMHAHVASMSSMHMPGMEHAGLDHAALNPHLLPGDAPILNGGMFHGMSGFAGGMKDMTGALGKDGMVLHSDALNPRGLLKVSGGLGDLSKAQFEGAPSGLGSTQPSELLSGPSISDTPVSTHLAGAQRLFDDRIQGTFFAKQGMQASLAANSPSSMTQGLQTHGGTLPSNLNVGASTLGAQPSSPPAMANDGGATSTAMPASNGMESQSLGPSGPIDHLGDAKQLIAANPAGESFRPSLGQQGPDYGASYLNSQPVDITPHAAAPHLDHAAGSVKPLHAKELSLDSVDGAGHHQVMDHIGHQSKVGSGFNHVSNAQDQISHRSLHQAYSTGTGHSSNLPSSHVKIASTPTPHPVQSTHAVSPSQSHAHAGAEHAKAGADKATDADADKAGDQSADQSATDQTTGDDQADAADATTDYTVKSGDNLWDIAKDHLGSGMKWHQIYDMNKDVLGSNPDLIFSGAKIKLPGTDLASAGTDASKYVVKSGDCLWNIAKDQMHDATKWSDLFKANQDVIGSNPRLIMPGQQLTLPGHESATTVADGSGAGDAGAADATSATEPAAQTAAAAAPAGPSSSFGSPATTDGAAAAPTEAPAAAPQAAPAMEAQPQMQPMQAPAAQPSVPHLPAGIPGAAMGAPASPFGGTAAGAATLHVMPLAQPHFEATTASAQSSVVNSSIGTDLATFLSKRK
jgi:nucleoid-associated protein YgaU